MRATRPNDCAAVGIFFGAFPTAEAAKLRKISRAGTAKPGGQALQAPKKSVTLRTKNNPLTISFMLIYHTTYSVSAASEANFLIYVRQVLVPAMARAAELSRPRLARILSHHDADTVCYALQFEVADSAALHRWYTREGARLNEDLSRTFQNEVASISTLLEEVSLTD